MPSPAFAKRGFLVRAVRDAPDVFVLLGVAGAALLRRAGVREIEISTECTACQPDRFWSHRRVGNDRGSLAAIIVCEGGNTK